MGSPLRQKIQLYKVSKSLFFKAKTMENACAYRSRRCSYIAGKYTCLGLLSPPGKIIVEEKCKGRPKYSQEQMRGPSFRPIQVSFNLFTYTTLNGCNCHLILFSFINKSISIINRQTLVLRDEQQII